MTKSHLPTFNNRVVTYKRNSLKKEDQIELLKSELDLPPLSGPVTSHLDIVLREHKICKQAYHGKSFIGNHCHACMKEETIIHT